MNFIHRTGIATLLALGLVAGAMAGEALPVPPTAPKPPSSAAPAAQAAQAEAAAAQSQAETERALAEAQQRLEVAAREVGELSAQLGNHMGGRRMIMINGQPMRAQLGVQISNTPSKDGAHVIAVSPGGPAAEAGIHDGDVITSIYGADLTRSNDAGRELVDQVRKIEPGEEVKVTVLRAGKKMDFKVAPRPMPQTFEFRSTAPMVGMAPFPGPGPGPGPGGRVFNLQTPPPGGINAISDGENWVYTRGPGVGERFRGMEFATLSEGLGSYFGVKSGVLVVRTGNNDAFKLKDGDVILAIDGREPGNAQHAGRILRSYRGGEKLTLRVQRDRKAQNIEVTLPGGPDNDD